MAHPEMPYSFMLRGYYGPNGEAMGRRRQQDESGHRNHTQSLRAPPQSFSSQPYRETPVQSYPHYSDSLFGTGNTCVDPRLPERQVTRQFVQHYATSNYAGQIGPSDQNAVLSHSFSSEPSSPPANGFFKQPSISRPSLPPIRTDVRTGLSFPSTSTSSTLPTSARSQIPPTPNDFMPLTRVKIQSENATSDFNLEPDRRGFDTGGCSTPPSRSFAAVVRGGPASTSSPASTTSRARTVIKPGPTSPKTLSREQRFICEYPECKARFTTEYRRQQHHKNHRDERGYECERCGKTFVYQSDLPRHRKSETACEKHLKRLQQFPSLRTG